MSDRHLPAYRDVEHVVLVYAPIPERRMAEVASNPVRFPCVASESDAVYYAFFGGLRDGEDGWI